MKETDTEKERESGSVSELQSINDRKVAMWDIVSNTGLILLIERVCKNLPQAQMDCMSLQQLVIDNMENKEVEQDMPSLRAATKLMVDFVSEVYYNKDSLKCLFK